MGNNSDNVFYPLDGNDIIDGKAGLNKVVLSRAASGFNWAINSSNHCGYTHPSGLQPLRQFPARRHSDRDSQKAGLRDESSPDKTGNRMAAPAPYHA
jgi:hypothetical protein